MHRLATVHARDNQPTNDQRRHDTAYLNKRLFYLRKVRRLKITKRWYYSTVHWHLGDVLVGNHLFVIFAVLDVSCAINLCINHSFFLHLLLISAIWIVDINIRAYSNCWYQQFELEISTIIIADITNSKRITDISNRNCWYQQFKLLISLIIIADINNCNTIADISNLNCWYQQFQLLISVIWIADINNCVTIISNYN